MHHLAGGGGLPDQALAGGEPHAHHRGVGQLHSFQRLGGLRSDLFEQQRRGGGGHGEDDVVGMSARLLYTGANTLLDAPLPGVRDALYKAVEGQDQLPGVEQTTPKLRSKMVTQVILNTKCEGWTAEIQYGIDEDDPVVGRQQARGGRPHRSAAEHDDVRRPLGLLLDGAVHADLPPPVRPGSGATVGDASPSQPGSRAPVVRPAP